MHQCVNVSLTRLNSSILKDNLKIMVIFDVFLNLFLGLNS